MSSLEIRSSIGLLTSSLALVLSGCGAGGDFPSDVPVDSELGESYQAIGGSCLGANDTDSLSATLAVAVANELGRWDVANDFSVATGKLEYSTTGLLLCGTGGVNCPQTATWRCRARA